MDPKTCYFFRFCLKILAVVFTLLGIVYIKNKINTPITRDSTEGVVGGGTNNFLENCRRPVSKIGFMKTHKTASTTVQNILMRYS